MISIKQKSTFEKADWSGYENNLNEKFNNYDNPREAYSASDPAEKNIPNIKYSTNPPSKFRPKPYWNPELSNSAAERRLALANFPRNPTPIKLIKLKKKITVSRRMIRQAQRQSWQHFCSSIDERSSFGELWNKIR